MRPPTSSIEAGRGFSAANAYVSAVIGRIRQASFGGAGGTGLNPGNE